MTNRMSLNYTPKQAAAAIAIDALYVVIKHQCSLPDDTNSYRDQVLAQAKKLLLRLAEQNKLEVVL